MTRRGFLHLVDGRSFAPHDGMIPLSCIEYVKRDDVPIDGLDNFVILINEQGLERVVRVVDVAKQLPRGYSVLANLSSPTTVRVLVGRTQSVTQPLDRKTS